MTYRTKGQKENSQLSLSDTAAIKVTSVLLYEKL